MRITLSRHSTDLANAEFVDLPINTKAKYKLRNGKIVDIVIGSEELLANSNAGLDKGKLSYDCWFEDTQRLEGAIKERIISWETEPTSKRF